ncbi:hypothetical protein Ciccas_013018 [Cichlidogyrus casuarinus]|uniref:Ig-like domain-containing protein n=1 Tax=Cichlidogyrus casuarinus TaxID=1844966 RepID=A0ABD2PRS4_9PLAT
MASLDFIYTYAEDSGLYSCTISNQFGRAQSNEVQINVQGEPEGNCDADYRLQVQSMNGSAVDSQQTRESKTKPQEVPRFVSQLVSANAQVVEGQGNTFEAAINVTSDSTLSSEWFKDGKPIGTGSRFNARSDRGYLSLEIAYCYSEDSGQYICVVHNALGQVSSNPVQFTCLPEASIVTKSILGESSMQSIKALEDPGASFDSLGKNDNEPTSPPSFKGVLSPANLEIMEDQSALFTVPVDAGSGEVLTLEWYKDGNLIEYGSRITGGLELGLASLMIKYAQPGDSGSIHCVVKNGFGQVQSNAVTLKCSSDSSIIAVSQLPGDKERGTFPSHRCKRLHTGLQAIEHLEALLSAPRAEEPEEENPMPEPSIVKQPEPVHELEDSGPVHFEALVEPAEDPSLVVEWFKDAKPLTSGTRFRVEYNRGLAMLDILHTIEEDSGEYWFLVKNLTGQKMSTKIAIKCSGSAQVITQSNLLEGSEGFNLIKSIEDCPDASADYNYQVEEADSGPTFDVKPQAVLTCEGGNAKFLVKLSGKPTPEVQWTINGESVKTDSNTKVYNDGAINYLEIIRCPLEASVYKIKVVGANQLGSAEAETVLTVQALEDFRPDLKHIKPTNPFKKMIGLKKVTVSEELNKALHKAKPSAEAIMNMERGSEMKNKAYQSPEVVEAENLLEKIAVNLRRSEVKRQAQE